MNNRAPAPLPNTGAGPNTTVAARRDDRGAYTPEPGPWGVNVNAIPLAADEAPAQPGRPWRGSRPVEVKPADKAADIPNPYRKSDHAEKDKDEAKPVKAGTWR